MSWPEFRVCEGAKWSEIAKFAILVVFKARQTRENPYILALIQGLGTPKMIKNHTNLLFVIVSKAANLRKNPIFFAKMVKNRGGFQHCETKENPDVFGRIQGL